MALTKEQVIGHAQALIDEISPVNWRQREIGAPSELVESLNNVIVMAAREDKANS